MALHKFAAILECMLSKLRLWKNVHMCQYQVYAVVLIGAIADATAFPLLVYVHSILTQRHSRCTYVCCFLLGATLVCSSHNLNTAVTNDKTLYLIMLASARILREFDSLLNAAAS